MYISSRIKLKGSSLVEVIVAMVILTLFWLIAIFLVTKIDFELNETRQQQALYYLNSTINSDGSPVQNIPYGWELKSLIIEQNNNIVLVEYIVTDRRNKVIYSLSRWEEKHEYEKRLQQSETNYYGN
ncbi:MAG: hypothetical protein JXA53_09305 [Bacteroidales bacterium]|nr:hypothetical protein [Bacteroidales bacterium]